ncbi:MAG: WecB/TagA/CpsF family glycosyltransferase, partial [Anaerolineales bacterium]
RRVYGPDLMLALCARSATTGHRHYFYGGAPGVPEQLASVLCGTFPGIRIAGAFSPPFRPLSAEEKEGVIRDIDRSDADIVWVGLGTPKQETWMAEFTRRLQAPVLIGVGAAFDFLTGRKPQAPLWMQRTGLEWLFRLMSEPKRLWRRYLYNNPRFILRMTAQMLGWKRYSIE